MAQRGGADALDELRRLVIDDRRLCDRLLRLSGDAFVAEVIAVARETGIEVSAHDVEAGLGAARRARLERWV
jgi:hypothetical protein